MENKPRIKITPKGDPKRPASSNSPQKTTSRSKFRIVPKRKQHNQYTELLSKYEESRRKNRMLRLVVIIAVPTIILTVLLIILLSGDKAGQTADISSAGEVDEKQKTTLGAFKVKDEGYIDSDKTFQEFFKDYLISEKTVLAIEELAEKEGVYKLKKAHKFRILADKENINKIKQFEYEPNPYRVLQFTLGYPVKLEEINKKAETKVETASGIIKTTFLEAINESGIDLDVMDKVVEALKWSIDFYHVAPGDKFKVVYEAKLADGEVVEYGDVYGIYFKNRKRENYAFLFNDGKSEKYLNFNAKPLKGDFLMAPIKYGRISSKYSLQRVHPVTGVNKPHFGTDYAAKEGTEIYSVANGIILEARFKQNNGNYVKIKHNGTYTTQYLHMSAFGPGIKSGARVRQGQLIGYVGSTGLATGPHVCFRFWKNGKQIDHYKEDLVTKSTVLSTDKLDDFIAYRNSLDSVLNTTSFFN